MKTVEANCKSLRFTTDPMTRAKQFQLKNILAQSCLYTSVQYPVNFNTIHIVHCVNMCNIQGSAISYTASVGCGFMHGKAG